MPYHVPIAPKSSSTFTLSRNEALLYDSMVKPIARPTLVPATNGDTGDRVKLEMPDIRAGQDYGRTLCLSFKTSEGKSKVNAKTKAWIRTNLKRAGYTLPQLREMHALTEPAYLEGGADPTRLGTPACEFIGFICQSVMFSLKSKIEEIAEETATVDITIQQAHIHKRRLSLTDSETLAKLLNDVVFPLLTPLWKDSILHPKVTKLEGGEIRNKIVREVKKWKSAWDVDLNNSEGSLKRLAHYCDGRAASTLQDFAHLRDLAAQLLLVTGTGANLQRLLMTLKSHESIVFDDERRILNDLRPALHRILDIAAALPEMKLQRVPDSFESSLRDTASTYRLSFSDGMIGQKSKPESVNPTVSEAISVTEVTLKPDMHQEINNFVLEAANSLKLEWDQWEGLAASAQTMLSEIESGRELTRADPSIRANVQTLLRDLMMACSAQAMKNRAGSSRKRASSSDISTRPPTRPITIASLCE